MAINSFCDPAHWLNMKPQSYSDYEKSAMDAQVYPAVISWTRRDDGRWIVDYSQLSSHVSHAEESAE